MPDDIERLRAEIQRVVKESEEEGRTAQAEREKLRREAWEEGIGHEAVEEMLRDAATIERYCKSGDPLVRTAAICIASQHWGAPLRFAPIFEKIGLEDAEPIVRAVALGSLGHAYTHTDDARVGALLAHVVRDRLEPAHVRYRAYAALFDLRGVPSLQWPCLEPPLGDFRFPDDVDWPFVESFLGGGKTPEA